MILDRLDPKLIRPAAYARKSNAQDASPELRSVEIQLGISRDRVKANTWPKLAYEFVDDGISGAEFEKRTDLLRAIELAKSGAFNVLLMSEGSRLGREMFDTIDIVRTMNEAGVAVVNSRTGKEIDLEDPEAKFLFTVESYLAERERALGRDRILSAMITRAKAGFVFGNCTYGYRDTRTTGPNGSRGPVVRAKYEPEAAIVVRIFERAADGAGRHRIARELNADRIPPPRASTRKHLEWSVGSIAAILKRSIYRGVWTWGERETFYRRGISGRRTRKIRTRPESERIHTPAPQLRIVSDVLWQRAHARIAEKKKYVGQRRRGHDQDSKYLLIGLARCKACGGPIQIESRPVPRYAHPQYYSCRDRRRRGASTCSNETYIPMSEFDASILAALEEHVLSDQVIASVLREYFAPPKVAPASASKQLRKDLAEAEAEIRNLIDLTRAGKGRRLESIWTAIESAERRRDDIKARQAEAAAAAIAPVASQAERRKVERTLRDGLAGLRIALKNRASARRYLRALWEDRPMMFEADGGPTRVRFEIPKSALLPAIKGIVGEKPAVPLTVIARYATQGYTKPYRGLATA